MRRDSEAGFTMVEMMIATGVLLAVLSGALWFFAKSQVIYTDERGTLEMVQDVRLAFDRLTNEIRMAGAGLPGYHGVVSGSRTLLIVRGDFSSRSTMVTGVSLTPGEFTIGTTDGFAVGQTISLLNTSTGASALGKITALNEGTNTIQVNGADIMPITSGAAITDFRPGTIINVIERRTYRVRDGADDPLQGDVTRTIFYEDTLTAGETVRAEETIARNLLTPEGAAGLRFTYFDAADNELAIDPDTGLVDKTKVAKVRIDLEARSAERDLQTGRYRTLHLTSQIQVRGQYVPAVGF